MLKLGSLGRGVFGDQLPRVLAGSQRAGEEP